MPGPGRGCAHDFARFPAMMPGILSARENRNPMPPSILAPPVLLLQAEAKRRRRDRVANCLFLGAALVAVPLILSACTGAGSQTTAAPAVALVAEDKPATAAGAGSRAPSNKPIPILVNDEPITQYDIAQRVRLMRLGGEKGGTREAADQLIDETLQLLEAQRRGVSVPEGQVNGAFASIADRLKLTPVQLTAALKGEGIEADSLKKRFRAQIAWQQLVQMRTAVKATVRSEDVTAQLLQKGDPNTMTSREFVLQQIVFVVPAGSPAALYQQRRHEAEAFRQRFQGCDAAIDQAKQLRGVVVKDIGRRDSSQLQGPQGEEVQKTPVGKTAPPNRIDQGIELVAVCSTRDVQSTAIARAEIENQLYLKQTADLGKDYLKELRDRAIIEYR
jgi:peptidyl-prolyl cis-trans isomerase SurA